MSDPNDIQALTPAAEPEVDESIMDFLTDEEREALEESDFLEDEATADPEPAADPESSADPDPAEAADPDPAPASDPDPQQTAPQMPDVDLNELDQQLAGFKDQRNAVIADYDDGDLTGAELQAKLDELDQKSDAVKAQKAVAMDQVQRVEDDWKGAVRAHFDAYPDLHQNDQVLQAFDATVRSVSINPAYAHMSFQQQLNAAHELLAFQSKQTGLQGVPALKGAQPEPSPDPDPKPDPKPEPEPKPNAKTEKDGDKPDMRTPPVTLANTPASDISGGSDSPYAALERLAQGDDPIAFENALMKLTPEQRDEFSSMDIG